MVNGGHDHKEAEEDNLDHQSTNHDMLPELQGFGCFACHDTAPCIRQLCPPPSEGLPTGRLHQEREHISSDKNLGEPPPLDDGEMLAIGQQDDTA